MRLFFFFFFLLPFLTLCGCDSVSPGMDAASMTDSGTIDDGSVSLSDASFDDTATDDAAAAPEASVPDAAAGTDAAVAPRFFNTGVTNETFDAALTRCRDLGMTLPILHSAAENDELAAFVAADRPSYAWLGININNPVSWIDGSSAEDMFLEFYTGGDWGERAIIDGITGNWTSTSGGALDFVRTVCQRI